MAKPNQIKNLDSLEKEIYRLKLEARNVSEKLSGQMDYLQQHYASMTTNSFFSCGDERKSSGKPNKNETFFHSMFDNKTFQDGVNSLLDRFAGRVEKLFTKWKS